MTWTALLGIEVTALWRIIHAPWLWNRVGTAVPFALLALSGLLLRRTLARGSPSPSWKFDALWLFAMVALWSVFWVLDLRTARVQFVMLALAPALALDWLCHKRVAGIFTVATWALLWNFFEVRADNGCTGVSDAYDLTQAISAPLLFLFGPWVGRPSSASPVPSTPRPL